MNRYRLVSILTLIFLLFSQNSYAVSESNNSIEAYDRGITYGIIPKAIQTSLDKTITYSEYCELLENVIRKYDSNLVDKWHQVAAKGLKSKQLMKRDDGMLATVYAAEVMGWDETNIDWTGQNEKMGDKSWEGFQWKYPNFPDWEKERTLQNVWSLGAEWNCNYAGMGLFYGMGRISLFDRKPLFDYDVKSNSMRSDQPFTRREAIQAAVRFAESEKYPFLCDKPVYVNINMIGKHTIEKSLYTGKTVLPEATNQKLPAWKGINLHDKMATYEGLLVNSGSQGADDRVFHESYIKFLSENGFNFVKVVLNFDTFSYPQHTTDNTVNINEILELDQLISWGMKYGVHIQISASGPPGSYEEQKKFYLENDGGLCACDLDLNINEKKLDSYTQYWNALAKRYADIPNNYLSFNLLNEPDFETDDILYKVCKPLVDAVRKESPDRVMTIPITSVNKVTTGDQIAKLGVALTAHNYYPIHFTFYDIINQECYNYAPAEWPMVYWANGMLKEGNRILTIKGDVDKGPLSLNVLNAWEGESVKIKADSKYIGDLTFKGGTPMDEGTIESIYSDQLFTTMIPKGTQKVTLEYEGSHFVEIKTVIVNSTAGEVKLYPHNLADRVEYHWFDQLDDPTTLIVTKEGKWYNENQRYVTAEDVYNADHNMGIKAIKEVADRNGVGFMVDDFGLGGRQYPVGTASSYLKEVSTYLRNHGVGYSQAYFFGSWALINRTGDFERKDSKAIKYTFVNAAGKDESFYYDQVFINALK